MISEKNQNHIAVFFLHIKIYGWLTIKDDFEGLVRSDIDTSLSLLSANSSGKINNSLRGNQNSSLKTIGLSLDDK